jgi:hypothetical protein
MFQLSGYRRGKRSLLEFVCGPQTQALVDPVLPGELTIG